MVSLSTAIITAAAVLTAKTIMEGRPSYMGFTFLFAIVIDQVKSIGMLFLAWYLLLRRCGYL